ncbi:helix-turn-helix domain-containing protein [Paenibacillus sp. LHD-117]|uniref:helix-turn-helix domain-containing protein n=1 Tax=Paenibacillus sp. LHD-117 TaxID=3071412 RepID=UPI0027E04A99|nr:helix-turn-helix domain-containing protein [Paenibacillus sp. LHD-117]MDQ6422273.1 helix-turn-helix domain-containing protein [Paenibacillus sp. LHD-117]
MATVFPYSVMSERPDALERLELRFQWGPYDIHVLRFHLTHFPAGRVIAFHKHAEFEFHFIPRGKGKVILVDQEFSLKPGQFYLTGPGVMHYQEAGAREGMDELCLHVDIVERVPKGQEEEDWEWAEARTCIGKLAELPLFPALDMHDAMHCFLNAYEACNNYYAGSYTTIKQNVIQILLRAVRAYDTVNETKLLPTKDMKAYRYQLAIEFMQANYGGPLSLEEVAEKQRLSSRQLQRLFKDMHEDGTHTFSRVLEDIRLAAVCKELAEGTKSIEEIATTTGFSTSNYLHAVFRKRYGMTPSDYRKQTILGG